MEPISPSETHTDEQPKGSAWWRKYTGSMRVRYIFFALSALLCMVLMVDSTIHPGCNALCQNAPVDFLGTETTTLFSPGSPLTAVKILEDRAHPTGPLLSTTAVIGGSTVVVTLPGTVFVSPFDTTIGTTTKSTSSAPVDTTPVDPPMETSTAQDTSSKSKATHKGTPTDSTSQSTMATGDGSSPTTPSTPSTPSPPFTPSSPSTPSTTKDTEFYSTTTLELTETVGGTAAGGAPVETSTTSVATMPGMKTVWFALLVAAIVTLPVTCL